MTRGKILGIFCSCCFVGTGFPPSEGRAESSEDSWAEERERVRGAIFTLGKPGLTSSEHHRTGPGGWGDKIINNFKLTNRLKEKQAGEFYCVILMFIRAEVLDICL